MPPCCSHTSRVFTAVMTDAAAITSSAIVMSTSSVIAHGVNRTRGGSFGLGFGVGVVVGSVLMESDDTVCDPHEQGDRHEGKRGQLVDGHGRTPCSRRMALLIVPTWTPSTSAISA